MTKVLITGHTSGIGKAILENCPSNYEVQGISRATGHNITEDLSDVLGYIKEYEPDIFFNNVWGHGKQNEIATWFTNRFEKGIMITTGSVSGYKHLVDALDNFYDHLLKQPYMQYNENKEKLLLEAFMWKLRNKDGKKLYWTNYSLGLTKTGLTNRDVHGNFDPTRHEAYPMIDPDDIAKRMWKDIENKLYLEQFEVALEQNRNWKDEDRVQVVMDIITNIEIYGA